jgi:REP element-mobilizing transposase RayT
MARKPRIHFPGALYHVITRGNRRQGVFLDQKDFKTFLGYLSDYKSRYAFRLYAYALMKNHLHLLVEVGEIPLSRIMQSLLFRYTRYFNRRRGEVGHLFQGRYKAILCDKDTYLLELVRYIHLNPVRAKIVRRPEDYVWTGHLSYLGRGGETLIDEGLVLDQFSEKRFLGRRRYRQFVWEGISGGHEDRYYQVKDQRYLGEDSFVERIEKERKGVQSWIYDLSLGALSEEISVVMGIPRGKLYSITKDREGARGRGVVGYLARRISGYGVKEIADHFGRSPVTISEGIKEVEALQRRDKRFAKTLSLMVEKVVKGRKRKYRITEA